MSACSYLFRCSSRERNVMRFGSGSDRNRCIMQFSFAAGSDRAMMKRSLIKWSVITHLNILNDSYFLLITQWCRFKCERGHTSALHEGRVQSVCEKRFWQLPEIQFQCPCYGINVHITQHHQDIFGIWKRERDREKEWMICHHNTRCRKHSCRPSNKAPGMTYDIIVSNTCMLAEGTALDSPCRLCVCLFI